MHSESQKCDFKSISKMRLGVAEGRLKCQLVQTFWNIKPWVFGGNSSGKHLCQLPTSSSGARMGSAVNKDFKISWIFKLDDSRIVKDGSQWVRLPQSGLKSPSAQPTNMQCLHRAFPRIISFNPHHRPVGACPHLFWDGTPSLLDSQGASLNMCRHRSLPWPQEWALYLFTSAEISFCL